MIQNKISIEERFNNFRLDRFLVEMKIFENRSKAVSNIMMGNVYVDEKKIDKSGYKVKKGSVIELKIEKKWVSRGGIKLSKVLETFQLNVTDKSCLDIGCSTGGFSDVILQNGASSVTGVDVGYGIIDLKVRNNERFKIFERTNARYLKPDFFKDKFDLIFCDVSFISLKKIIPPLLIFLKKDGLVCLLVKPQFEVGKSQVGRGGIVKDEKVQKQICSDIRSFFERECSLRLLNFSESVITGQKGNKEYFMLLKK